MALTLQAEQRLESVDLIQFFTENEAQWAGMAEQSYDFTRQNFPAGAPVRPDDVADILMPLLEVSELLHTFLAEHKLTQKYWVRHFCDLILDRTWPTITQP